MGVVGTAGERRRGLWRSRWAAIGAAVAVTLGGGGIFVAQAVSGPASSVVSIDPVRILDTRTDVGLPGPFVSAVSQKLKVTGPVPTSTGTQTPVPVGATGVLLNVTVVNPTAAGFLAVRPGDATGAPSTSSLNFNAGDIVPNSVQVGLPTAGANAGQIDITSDAFGQAGPTTEVLIDVVGYLVAGGAGVGPAGPQGPAGPAGPVNLRWAKVSANATLTSVLSGNGVTSITRTSAGTFDVTFNGTTSGCGWTATLNDNSDGIAPFGEISIEAKSVTTPEVLTVRMWNSAGVPADPLANDGFTVMVICPT